MPLRTPARRMLSMALLCLRIRLGLPRAKRSTLWSLRFGMMRTQTGVLSVSSLAVLSQPNHALKCFPPTLQPEENNSNVAKDFLVVVEQI